MLVQIINLEACRETLLIIFKMFISAVVVSSVLALLCNWANAKLEKEHARRREEIQNSLMPNWSLKNAMKINRETCNYVHGDVRLSKGMYRTPEETEKYIEESLIRPLP